MYRNSYKPLLLVYLFIVGSLAACGSDEDEPSQYNRPAVEDVENLNEDLLVALEEGPIRIFENSYTYLPVDVAPYLREQLSYQWTQLEGKDIALSDYSVYSPRITTPSVDELTNVKYELKVFNANGSKLLSTKNVDVSIIPFNNRVVIPNYIGRGCEVEIEKKINSNYIDGVRGHRFNRDITLEVFDEHNNLLVQKHISSHLYRIPIVISEKGEVKFVTTLKDYDDEVIKIFENVVEVLPLLPTDIKGMDYVVNRNEKFFLCEDTSVWRESSLTLKDGAILATQTGKKIELWGNMDIQGVHDNRVTIDGVEITKSSDNPVHSLSVNVNYADFNYKAKIYNFDGVTNIYNSTFNSYYYQSSNGELKYNTFNNGISLSASREINFSFNDVNCSQGALHCIKIWSYRESNDNSNILSFNNIYGAQENSVVYNDEYIYSSAIGLSNNYWDLSLVNSIDDIFEDANDKPEKSKIFTYDPYLNSPSHHSQDDSEVFLP